MTDNTLTTALPCFHLLAKPSGSTCNFDCMKVEFFRRSVELVEKYRRPNQIVQHTFQTNGILLDDEWCTFFKEHNFLVGLSVDGPREIHNANRIDRGGQGTFDRVMKGWRQLRKHRVDFNILCTVNAANEKHGRLVYRFFRDGLCAEWMQFIPIVERATTDPHDVPIMPMQSDPLSQTTAVPAQEPSM